MRYQFTIIRMTITKNKNKKAKNSKCWWGFRDTAILVHCFCFSVAQSCPILCNLVDCSTPGFPVLHHLLELAQTHVHWVSDVIQPFHPLSTTSPPAFNLSQHLDHYSFTKIVVPSLSGNHCALWLRSLPRVHQLLHILSTDYVLKSCRSVLDKIFTESQVREKQSKWVKAQLPDPLLHKSYLLPATTMTHQQI